MTSANEPNAVALKCPQCGANLPDSSEGEAPNFNPNLNSHLYWEPMQQE